MEMPWMILRKKEDLSGMEVCAQGKKKPVDKKQDGGPRGQGRWARVDDDVGACSPAFR
jgi:hypothetical protein